MCSKNVGAYERSHLEADLKVDLKVMQVKLMHLQQFDDILKI